MDRKFQGQSIFILALAILGITTRAFCYQAEVTDISGMKYFPAVKEALSKAEKSIYLVMFTIQAPQVGENSKVSQLIDTLIEAKNRGVDVEVILDQNVDFVRRKHPGDWEVEIKSTRAFKRLKEAGIKVYYDEPTRYAHAKTVIIDKKIVILGSTNWSESAFDNSIETDLLVNSAELADEILSYLKTIKIDEAAEEAIEIIGPSTAIDRDFLENPGLAPRMVKMSAMRNFDVYLYLLWKHSGTVPLKDPEIALTGTVPFLLLWKNRDSPQKAGKNRDSPQKAGKNRDSPQKAGTVPISYEDMAKYLGIYEGWTTTDYRRQIIRALRNLERRYKLIKFEPHWGKEAKIELLGTVPLGKQERVSAGTVPIPNDYFNFVGTVPLKDPEIALTGTVPIPNDYFNFGWNRELSLRAKFCLFITMYYFQMSDTKPFWSESIPTLTKQFGGIGRDVIIKGMEELRRKKLIEVKYDELRGKPYDIKAPKSYKLLKLYDPKELELKLKAIEDKYGRQDYTKARRYAQLVFEENNPQIIEDIILKTRQYGEEKIKKAFYIVAQKNTDNPKKSYAYVVGIIENK